MLSLSLSLCDVVRKDGSSDGVELLRYLTLHCMRKGKGKLC